jgi:hypothetical protein
MIRDELKSFLRIGSVPRLSLPSILVSSKGRRIWDPKSNTKTGGPKKEVEQKDEKEKPSLSKMKGEPEWYKVNPGPEPGWGLPAGKEFSTFFGLGHPENR